MQSFYQFYQKRLQKSSNTDDLFVEAFDKANLDGVQVIKGFNSINYKFEDEVEGEKYYYEVDLYGNTILKKSSDKTIADFLDKYDDLYSQFKMKYPKSFDKAEIYLTIKGSHVSSNYMASNLGNHSFVYGKMIACIQDAVSKHKPLFLKFSGAENSMDLVYDSLIKMSQRVYPQDAYVPFLNDYYIRKEVYDLIANDDNLELAKKEREDYLKYVRNQKNLSRIRSMRQVGI